jgi:acyl-coenzyme A thioesterase PaaI-like protein
VSLADALRAARAARDPDALCRLIPYGVRIGVGAELRGDDLVGILRFSPDVIGNPVLPALHGGAIGSFLEWAAIFQLLWDGEVTVLPRTINLTIDFLRSGRPVDTYARAIVTKQGRRVANVRVEAWQEDPARPIAVGHGHFLVAGDE